MMLRVSKVALTIGLACFASATVMVALDRLRADVGLSELAMAVGGLGLAVFGFGVAAVLRWQSRTLTRITRALGMSSPSHKQLGDSADDLGEVVRVVDSRIVGFIEAIQDETIRSD